MSAKPTMTPEAINHEMALLDGWDYHPSEDTHIYQWRREDREWFRSPPGYTKDLNAVARVVGRMNDESLSGYRMLLRMFADSAIDATAMQRCEAILRAVGKWVDG